MTEQDRHNLVERIRIAFEQDYLKGLLEYAFDPTNAPLIADKSGGTGFASALAEIWDSLSIDLRVQSEEILRGFIASAGSYTQGSELFHKSLGTVVEIAAFARMKTVTSSLVPLQSYWMRHSYFVKLHGTRYQQRMLSDHIRVLQRDSRIGYETIGQNVAVAKMMDATFREIFDARSYAGSVPPLSQLIILSIADFDVFSTGEMPTKNWPMKFEEVSRASAQALVYLFSNEMVGMTGATWSGTVELKPELEGQQDIGQTIRYLTVKPPMKGRRLRVN